MIGAMLRARAATEPGDGATETLIESAAILERSGPPHELARSLVDLGAAQRRRGRRSESGSRFDGRSNSRP